MKLSKVKKVVLNRGALCVANAETGIDVRTWIGTDDVMYPVHEIFMTAVLAARIWELTPKQMNALHIDEDENSNIAVLIGAGDLESLPMLAEAENGVPTLYELCRIDDKVILMDGKTGQARYFRADVLAPTEGVLQYFGAENSSIVGAYSDGVLEAAIYTGRWEDNEILRYKFKALAEAWERKTN